MYSKAMLFALIGSFCLSIGCGGSDDGLHTFKGKATRNGKPIKGLLITFTPDDLNSKAAAMGATGDDGSFELKIGSSPGVYPGKHTVTCQDPLSLMGGKTSTDKEYLAVIKNYAVKTSKLTVDVTKDELDYELKLD